MGSPPKRSRCGSCARPAVAARVPGHPGHRHDPPGHRRARPGHRDHPAAGAALRRRRRHPLLRHHDPGARHRVRRRHRPRRRPGGRPALPRGRRPRRDSARSTPSRHALRPRDGRNLVAELDVPLIAFAGAPFTVASYLVEGRPSRTYARTKALMHTDEALWFTLMDRLADLAIASLRSQVDHGASAVQLFDSWAGALSPADYDRFVLPASTRRCSTPSATSACPASTSASHRRAAGPDGRRPAPTWSASTGAPRSTSPGPASPTARSCRATSTRPSCAAGWDADGRRRAATSAPARRRRGRPRPHLQPRPRRAARRPTPAVLERLVELVHAAKATADVGDADVTMTVGVLVMAYGTPSASRRRRGVLHPHPPGSSADRRAARRPASAATTPSAASRPWPQRTAGAAAAPSRPRWTRRPRSLRRASAATSTPRRSSRTRSPRSPARASTGSSASCSPRTTRRRASASTTNGRAALSGR